jgi:predicted SprT family Zn-dependent metalloprotease
MISRAYFELFNEPCEYTTSLKYSHAFKGFNANIKMRTNHIEVRMSREWKGVSEDIQVGLIQLLLTKLFNKKEKRSAQETINMDLYKRFIKTLPKYTTVTKSDPTLLESFNRVNNDYFNGFLETPNLTWGEESFSKLGTYEYATDTVRMSTILAKDANLLDYVMYHELLHKKLQFYDKNGRSFHHTHAFKELEKKYKDPDAEAKLHEFLRRYKRKSFFKFW